MSRFIKNCRKKFTILKDDYRRKHPPKHAGNEIYGLGAKQVYPHGINFDECLMLGVKDDFNNIHFTSKTPVASIGTCFAEELSRHLNTIKFNYVHTEDNIWGASANWGRVYTVPNLCQIFHYSFEASFPLTIEYSKSRSMKKKELGFFDPLRDGSMTDQNKQIVIEDIINHRKASSQAFKTAHLLFITLGQNEAWLDNKNGLIWAHRPPQDILDKDPSRFIVKTFEQAFIEEELKKGLLTLFKVNPDLKVIFSVSPVPAYATFQSKGVITESFHNKCLLRVVVERTIQQFPDRTFYFPSFEMVMSYNPGSLIADNRHVRRKVVERIMNSLDSSVM